MDVAIMCVTVPLTKVMFDLHTVAMIIDDDEFFYLTNVLTTTGL